MQVLVVDESRAPTLAALQAKLGCGTSCGSCVPELKRMLATREREAA